jgi:carbonic anhydrase/acetyltransferase-like protein (isoleucine patch superfamily)
MGSFFEKHVFDNARPALEDEMPIYELGETYQPILPTAGEYWIAPTAAVVGRVKLERNASIWWGSTLRGDNDLITVGENSNVQDGSVLHTDPGIQLTIGKNVTVGHKVMLHGCTIEDGALIGINSVILNRARIGAGSLVGAGALITEGKAFPPGVLIIGAPARVSRELKPDEKAMLKRAAEHYVLNWQRYAKSLREI